MGAFGLPCLLLWTWTIVAASGTSDEDFQTLCADRCPFQNKTDSNFDVGCGNDCRIDQCSRGCLLWRKALESSCQTVCNGTQGTLSQRELHCVMGCNDAMNQYFQRLKDEIGVPPAPYLVADTLTATSLSLAWEGARYSDISYLVQWRYEEHAGAWQYCRNQSWGPNSVVLVENLQPYTKYRFRVALLLSPHSEPIVSEPSVVINTLAAGVPSSPPTIIRATAVDAKRISVSWKPGAFPNGPIHSYVLELVGEYTSLKEDIPATKNTDFYMFQNLNANSKYVVSVSMRNAVGEGPAATAEVSTPSEPSVKDTLQPILILGSKLRVIKQGADMMLDVPVVIYESSSLITGIGIHVSRNLLFVSDSDGYVSVTSLKKFSQPKHVLTPSEMNFQPLDLSVDWLNQHLYILGEVSHRKSTLWQVARCGLDGRSLTVAVAGITSRPLHIEVDPYNGYLFWLIRGHNRGGLYRLDLAHISNGIKREVIPDMILEDPNLGAFIVDHTNFCILVPNHAKNTVFSVSLDGREVIDMRANTQQALFQNVISLAIANGLFYWTNGEEVLAEDYHEEYHTYFHNHYLGSRNRSYISVSVDLPTTQPIPVPVNPPIHVQAVLGGHAAKVSWQTPHLVGGQGKGAWQNWSYELQIRNERTGEVRTHSDITNATFATVDDLDDDTEYVFKAAAYTPSGNGPWSSEFRGKTLKTPEDGQYPTILWSAAEGLLQSDVTGEEVETLVPQEKLKDYHFVDIAWFDDRLYLVSNTTRVYWYNLTSHEYRRFHHLESVGSIAVDWIGRKLYWSNPKQQVILRGDLEGRAQENLPILTVAKELNIDSEHAFIYWSTGLAVECARLNGDSRRVYYPPEWFPGKHVKGLTLNMDDRHVYWIVRSNEGSTLYKAPMAEYSGPSSEIVPVKVSNLQHPNMQGPLCYFNDHLLWLQDDKNAVIGDLSGRNEALMSGVGLSGLNVVAVIDNSFRRKLGEGLSVVPSAVDESSIRVVGTSSSFNITWQPARNVNFGQVFYELKTEDYASQNHVRTTEHVLPYDRARQLHPYSELRVTVQAFTYWGTSPPVKAVLHSPESPPSAPTKPRVFVTRHRNSTTGETEVVGLLRWDFPDEPNGLVRGYRVKCRYVSGDSDGTSHIDLDAQQLELELKPLLLNSTYYFQVQAFTSAGEGPYSEAVRANTSVETPVPTLLVATKDSIKVTDCDRKKYKVLFSGDQPVDITLNNHEGTVYWLNELQEILRIRLDGTGKTKIHTLNSTGLGIAVDWIGRFLYWSELEEPRDPSSVASSLYRMDLNQVESGFFSVERIARRSKRIHGIEVSPFTDTVLWIELSRHGAGHLIECRTDGTGLRPVFAGESRCSCPENPRIGRTFAADQTDPRSTVVIYSDEQEGHIYQAEIKGCNCRVKVHSPKLPPLSIATDHRNLYWSSQMEDVIYILEEDSEVREFAVRGVRKIRAVGTHLQPLPPPHCLAPRQSTTATAMLVDSTATSITLRLPKPQRHGECSNVSLASVQYTIYFGLVNDGGTSDCVDSLSACRATITYRETVTLEDLKPFSSYVFMVSLKNHYSDVRPVVGPPAVFATSAGAPSPPRNVTVVVIDPTVVEVSWYPPRDLNDKVVWYEIHWRTEGTIAGVRQSGEQIVEDTDSTDAPRSYKRVVIRKLIPGQPYLLWVRAYSQNSDEYSDSEGVETEMFQQPSNITLLEATPYSLEITWTPPDNLSLDYEIQYCRNTGDWLSLGGGPGRYLVENLSPKTSYRFRASILYSRSTTPYLWPQDRGFTFETLGDRPSRPGTPVIQHLRRDVYQVIWERSRDNGAEIHFYILEGRFRTIWRNKRDANFSLREMNDRNDIDDDDDDGAEDWTIYYNGTDNYWIITELSPSLEYVFRVRAKNEYGWSDSSEPSKSFDFTEAAMLADQQELGIVLVTTVTLVVLFCVVLLTTFCCLSKRREKEKKDLKILTLATRGRGPDVELATLRELPRRGNFIHNANILYAASPDPPRDDEIALLPPVRRDQFKLTKFLGSGAFGEVYEGIAQGLPGAPDTETRVAIKALRKGATDQEKAEFLKEAQLMSHFKHEHILQLLGVCLDNDPNYILMELMEGGDLLSYLRLNRPLIATNNSIQLQDLLAICVDVAKGCRYLEEMHFVHRDLACRNCLVSSADPATRIVKIGDFGLARDIYKNDYYRKEGEGLLPVRWMAPESLIDGVFTTQSDVWAFGVLVWEIMTLGQQPYPARTNLEVLHYVRNGGRLGRPNNCSEELYQLMLKSWSFNPELRPTFKYCLECLEELKSRTANAPVAADVGSNHPEAGAAGHDDGVENDGFRHDDDCSTGTVRKSDEEEEDEQQQQQEEEETSRIPGEPHRYLELIYAEDGYEVPRLDGCPERRRTTSASSLASEGSASTLSYPAPLVESDNATYFDSKELSTLHKLLPNGTVPNGFKRDADPARSHS